MKGWPDYQHSGFVMCYLPFREELSSASGVFRHSSTCAPYWTSSTLFLPPSLMCAYIYWAHWSWLIRFIFSSGLHMFSVWKGHRLPSHPWLQLKLWLIRAVTSSVFNFCESGDYSSKLTCRTLYGTLQFSDRLACCFLSPAQATPRGVIPWWQCDEERRSR